MGDKVLQTKQTSFDSYENHHFLFRLNFDSSSSPLLERNQYKNTEIKFTKSFYEERVEIYCNSELQEVELFVTSSYDTLYSTVQTALEDCLDISSSYSTNVESFQLSNCLTPHIFPPQPLNPKP